MLAQCSKLRVHPAPGVHNLPVGYTHFDTCALAEGSLFQSISMSYVLGLCTQKNCICLILLVLSTLLIVTIDLMIYLSITFKLQKPIDDEMDYK